MDNQKKIQRFTQFIVIVLFTFAIWAGSSAVIIDIGKINIYEHDKKIEATQNLQTSKVQPTITSLRNITPTASKKITTQVVKTPIKKPSATQSSGKKITNITITAIGFAFDQKSVTVSPGSQVIITFKNDDAGIPHNIAVYTDSTLKTRIFKGEIITGSSQIIYPAFKAPDKPGVYFFRCDVHPMMTGQFIVK